MISLYPQLVPKNGHTLKMILICRVSSPGAGKQDIRSLDDQERLLRAWRKDHYRGPVEIKVIAGSGSGERLDRQELVDAEAAIDTGEYDLVLAEDLGRIMRRTRAFDFCEQAEDTGTRVIAINDGVDTGREEWRMSAFFAAMRHEMSNADSGKRIRRTLRNRFENGGAMQFIVFGYIKPHGAKHDNELQKDPDAEVIYDEWFTRLEEGATFAAIADWLYDSEIPTGPYCRSEKWDGAMVARITRNPILKGIRQRNNKNSKRINATGRYRSVKAPPEDLLERECPHLAFIEPARYDRVLELVNRRNAKYRRKGQEGRDMRAHISKKRTRFPGQCIYCGVCGRLYVFGGHGQKDKLMCSGAHEYKCWNAATVDGPLAADKLVAALFEAIEELQDFDETFIESVQQEATEANRGKEVELSKLKKEKVKAEKELSNLIDFVKDGRASSTLGDEIASLEEKLSKIGRKQDLLSNAKEVVPQLPSADELKKLAKEALRDLSTDNFECADLLRKFTPRIVVFPHRLCDGGGLVLRAKLKLHLAEFVPDKATQALTDSLLERTIELDFFKPPQRELHRFEVVEMRQRGEKFSLIGEALGITDTAAQRAAKLQSLMEELGLEDPYLPVSEPPTDLKKLKRHKHARYEFSPLPDAGQL